jgi:hypothetical protein
MDFRLLFRSLKHRNFRLFFMGQGISLIGTWMQMTAVAWLVWRSEPQRLAARPRRVCRADSDVRAGALCRRAR